MNINIKAIVEKCLKETRAIFLRYPGIFLTETDVVHCIAAKLLRNSALSKIEKTKNKDKSVAVHTEVRWYGRNRNLNMRSDIVVLDPRDLRTNGGAIVLPSKSYAFDKAFAVIEVKLRRDGRESNGKFIKRINEDIDRLNTIYEQVDTFPAYLLILDKSDIGYSLTILRDSTRAVIKYESLKNRRSITQTNLSRFNTLYPYDRRNPQFNMTARKRFNP